MIRPLNVFAAAAMLMLSLSVMAQHAEILEIPEALRTQRSVCGAAMDAGTIINIGSLSTQSNDIAGDPIVLCFGDQILINHAGDAVFDGDPDASTTPGVGYAFYSCPPTITGQERDNITAMDGCLVDMPVPAQGIWVARGNAEGDIVFHNNGTIQNQFFGGDAGRMWFAPITITNFEATPPSFDDGSCLNVNVAEAFSVVYLNEITLVDFSTPDNSSLAGMLTLAGGYSEIDGSNYTVTLTKIDDPSVQGTIDALVGHNGTTTFSVPEEGLYTLSVTDDKGCTKEFIVSVPNLDPVQLCLSDTSVMPEENFCMPITVADFNNILSVAFTISWDPSVIDLLNVSNIHPTLGGNAGLDDTRGSEGILTFLFFELSLNTISLPDSAILFELCYAAVGPPGSQTAISFVNNPTGINVTDDNDDLPLLIKSGSVVLTNPDKPTVFYGGCANSTGGVDLRLQVFGGADPYVYDMNFSSGADYDDGAISGGGAPTVLLDVPKDVYDIVITDGAGAMTTLSIDLTVDPISIDSLSTDPTCMGSDDGSITITDVIGGDGNYSYTWFGPGFTRYGTVMLDDLTAGTYKFLVTDGNGCSDSAVFNLEDGALAILETNRTLPICSGQAGGSFTFEVPGAMAEDYTWTWSDSLGNNRTFSSPSPMTFNNLEPGQYYLTLDNGLCEVSDTFSLGALKTLSIDVDPSTTTSTSCGGDRDGRIDVFASADLNQSAFSFFWDQVTMDSGIITTMGAMNHTFVTDLPGGAYTLRVVDLQGCEISQTFIIDDPDPIVIDGRGNVIQPSCPNGSDGRIDLGFADLGGTQFGTPRPPYLFQWYDINDGRDSLIGTTTSIRNLSAGDYRVEVEDANGCQSSGIITLVSGPSVVTTLSQANICRGDSMAQLTISGDLTGNSILWSTGETTETISNLKAGLYTVSVTESSGAGNCTVVDSIQIIDPVVDLDIIRPMQFAPRSNCAEPDSGIIFNHLTNYPGAVNYVWTSLNDTVTAGPFISVTSDGIYTFEVQDRRTGCIVYDSLVNVQFPEKVSVQIDSTNVSCNGDSDGSLVVSATGRGGLFDFTWSDGTSDLGTTSSTLQNLLPGTYDITVTESTDTACIVPLSLEIREPDVLTLTLDSALTTDIRCFGELDGQIGLIWEGGNQDAAPTIVWSAGGVSNTLLASNLPAGTYDIMLTDSKGCSDIITHTIIEPAALQAVIPTPAEPICNGSQTIVTVSSVRGGTGSNYAFSVDNGPTQSLTAQIPVFSGDHLVTVFDERGCKLDTMFFISEPAPVEVDLGEDLSVALGDSVRLNSVVTGPSAIDSYSWTPADSSLSCLDCSDPFASPFQTQVYELRVLDINGCEGFDDILIQVDKARLVYIPNGFTPNNDNVNDLWQVHTGPGVRNILSTRVFDRWGNLVFIDDQPQVAFRNFVSRGWDGRTNGSLLNAGVYAYLVEIEFIDGRIFTYRGDVTLID